MIVQTHDMQVIRDSYDRENVPYQMVEYGERAQPSLPDLTGLSA